MAEIRPFRALRFTDAAGRLQELTCPPYDIISESQRLSYLKRNPHNIIRLELPRDGEDPYAAAGDVLQEWLREGSMHGTISPPSISRDRIRPGGPQRHQRRGGGPPQRGRPHRPGPSGGVLQGYCAAP